MSQKYDYELNFEGCKVYLQNYVDNVKLLSKHNILYDKHSVNYIEKLLC